jgi:asparagine synthase (glutamine-hydrolysing)
MMSKICGWLEGTRAASPRMSDPSAGIRLMGDRLGGLSSSALQYRLGAGCAVAVRATPGETEVCKDGGVLLALAGRPTWSDAALRERAAHTGMAQSVLHAWRERGRSLLESLHGSFSLALLDSDRGEALLAIDRVGTNTLCYARRGSTLVFGATADAVTAHPDVAADVDPQSIFDYLYSHMVPAPATIYRDVWKLLPAQYLHLKGTTADTGFYWSMPYDEAAGDDYERHATRFRELLEQSVRSIGTGDEVGAFLSGGTDSSTVAGVMARVAGHGPHTYSIGFDAEGFDEMEYARIASSHFGCKPHEYYVTSADVTAAIPRIAALYDEPFGNASAVPTYLCARMARENGRTMMLAGDGGDEIFGGNARYADQEVFERYGRLPAPLRGVLGGVFGNLPDALAIGVFRRARNYVNRARIPLPDRMEVFNHVEREGASRILQDRLLSGLNPHRPLEFAREVYGRTRSTAMVDRMMHLDLKQTLADSDLRKVSRMCELADIDVRYPLLDERLMEFSAPLPANYKVRDGQLRWFFKDALKDFLPQAVITKSKHGFGLPFGLWMQQDAQLGRLAKDSLDALVERRVVKPEFVQHLLERHRSEHASYYGVMIWVLMMLEQWLQSHPQARLDT